MDIKRPERDEVDIVRIILRGPMEPARTTPGYVVPVWYMLADGQRIEGRPLHRYKKDAYAYILSLPLYPGNARACFLDGEFTGLTFKVEP